MNPETPNTPEAEFPLKYWYGRMSEEDQQTIEVEIFNQFGEIPIEYALNNTHDQETARGFMGMFKKYIERKNSGVVKKDVLKSEAHEISNFINKTLLA